MDQENNRYAVKAMLAEYKNVVIAFQKVIANISFESLSTLVDTETTGAKQQSIQNILTDVISSGYSYAGYIRKLKKITDHRPGKMTKMSAIEYHNDLTDLIAYTDQTFQGIQDDELEEFNEKKKIKTPWGVVYDIEQMMEHAALDVVRHRRQIERFRIKLESA